MTCPKCGSANVTIQAVTETNMKKKHHGIAYWIFFGWLIDIFLWIFLTLPMLIVQIFKPRKYKMNSKTHSQAICQNCGNSWALK